MDVSIVITAYNYARYIGDCLDSCLQQSGTSLKHEVIVVDDGSTDTTPAILAARADAGLRCVRTANAGIEWASNLGFELARGRYIVRVDADDRLHPDYLANVEHSLHGGAGFIYADYNLIDEAGAVTDSMNLPDFDEHEIRSRGDFLATGTLFAAPVLRQAGGYTTTVRNSGLENFELMLRLLQSGVRGLHVPRRLFDYRRHAANLSETRRAHIIAHGHDLCRARGLGGYRTNQFHPYQLKLEVA